jgi:hypothetical protein
VSHSVPRSGRRRPCVSRAKEIVSPLGSSRRGVLRSPHSTRAPGAADSKPARIASSVLTFTQPLAALGTCTQYTSTGPRSVSVAAATADSGLGTTSGLPTSVSGVREATITHIAGRCSPARARSPPPQVERTWTSPRSSKARVHSGSVRRVTSCRATTSGSRAAKAVACSASRSARRATFQVISRKRPGRSRA